MGKKYLLLTLSILLAFANRVGAQCVGGTPQCQILIEMHDSDAVAELFNGLTDHLLSAVKVAGIEQVHRVEDDPKVRTLYSFQHLYSSVRAVHDVFPDGLDRHCHAVLLSSLNDRLKASDK